jgi:hypothetical protein
MVRSFGYWDETLSRPFYPSDELSEEKSTQLSVLGR